MTIRAIHVLTVANSKDCVELLEQHLQAHVKSKINCNKRIKIK